MNARSFRLKLAIISFTLFSGMLTQLKAADTPLHLDLRSRQKVVKQEKAGFVIAQKPVDWEPMKTAMIICDMWDDHWCKGAASRVAELAGPMNELVKAARSRGVFIIHSPSSVTGFY